MTEIQPDLFRTEHQALLEEITKVAIAFGIYIITDETKITPTLDTNIAIIMLRELYDRHINRVTELLKANSAEVDRRRIAEAEVKRLDHILDKVQI